jgi:hypothetical protein
MKDHPTHIPSVIWCEKCDERAGIIIFKKKILCIQCFKNENKTWSIQKHKAIGNDRQSEKQRKKKVLGRRGGVK